MKALAWVGLIVLDIPCLILRGFVLSQLWHWFIVPLGVREIGIALAIGITVLVGMMARDPFVKKEDEDATPMERAVFRQIAGIIASLFAWGFGAIVAAFL